MPIKVLVDSIASETIQQIIDYYNANKQVFEQPIERLNRVEGGFQINIRGRQNSNFNSNEKCQQLRWDRGQLVSGPYIGFTQGQESLLYNAFSHIMGENVIWMA